MEQKIINYQINWKNLEKITFILIYALFAFFFLINGEGLFDDWGQNWTWTTIIYLVGVSVFLGIEEKLPTDLKSPVFHSVIGFGLAFIIATIIFTILHDANLLFSDISPMPMGRIPATFIYQLVIVVCSEEIIFRGVVYSYIRKFSFYLAVFLSSAIFAVFHFVAYQGSWSAMMMAFLIGIILALCLEKWNLGVSVGVHFAWNAFILGITALV